MFGDWFVPPRRLPFPYLGLLASMATQVSGDTACGSMGLLNQHKVPNCLPLWFQLLPMGNCTQGPIRVPICLRNLIAHPIEVPAKVIVGQVTPANQMPPVVLPMEAQVVCPWFTEGMDPGSIESPGPGGEARSRKSTGQRTTTQMEAPICLQWHGPWQDILDQAPDLSWQIWCPSWSITDIYPYICMTMWRSISKRCWILVPSGSPTVHGLAW